MVREVKAVSALAKAVSKRWGETKIGNQKIEKDGLLATGDNARQE
jgi:hypothetical protein